MKILIGKEAITQACTSISTRGKKLDSDIHICGVSCLNHIDLHGDVTLLNTLFTALPKGLRSNAFKEWAEVHGKVNWSEDIKGFTYDKTKVTLLKEAQDTSWTVFKPEGVYHTMDFAGELAKLLKKAQERSGANKGDTIDMEMLKRVASAVSIASGEVQA